MIFNIDLCLIFQVDCGSRFNGKFRHWANIKYEGFDQFLTYIHGTNEA